MLTKRPGFRYARHMAKRRETAADRLRQAAAPVRRSALYRWMEQNFDEFSQIVAEAGRPNWRGIAEVLASEGLRNLRNEPPSPEGARLTWVKVRKAVAARRRRQSRSLPPAVTAERQPMVGPEPQRATQSAVAPESASHADEQLARLDALFAQAKPKMPRPL